MLIYVFRMFAREQYFDSAGLFITVVYSGPILLNCFIMTVSIFIDNCLQKNYNCDQASLYFRGGKERLIQLLDYSSAAP